MLGDKIGLTTAMTTGRWLERETWQLSKELWFLICATFASAQNQDQNSETRPDNAFQLGNIHFSAALRVINVSVTDGSVAG